MNILVVEPGKRPYAKVILSIILDTILKKLKAEPE